MASLLSLRSVRSQIRSLASVARPFSTPTGQVGVPSLASVVRSRPLSTPSGQVGAVNKLKTVLEEYRQHNFAQCLPTRFKKELVKEAIKSSSSCNVGMEGMQNLLTNIGANDRVSLVDLHLIFKEVGNEAGEISADRFAKLF
mmetsp:Transcript_6934/g.8998  ORF Transcript_6934/g.8998 Transcript_6934/m.8998 type:complete len:142 (+) Transcript_6934:84-509(+)